MPLWFLDYKLVGARIRVSLEISEYLCWNRLKVHGYLGGVSWCFLTMDRHESKLGFVEQPSDTDARKEPQMGAVEKTQVSIIESTF